MRLAGLRGHLPDRDVCRSGECRGEDAKWSEQGVRWRCDGQRHGLEESDCEADGTSMVESFEN